MPVNEWGEWAVRRVGSQAMNGHVGVLELRAAKHPACDGPYMTGVTEMLKPRIAKRRLLLDRHVPFAGTPKPRAVKHRIAPNVSGPRAVEHVGGRVWGTGFSSEPWHRPQTVGASGACGGGPGWQVILGF